MLKNGFVVALLACAVALQQGEVVEAKHHALADKNAHHKDAHHGVSHKEHHRAHHKQHHVAKGKYGSVTRSHKKSKGHKKQATTPIKKDTPVQNDDVDGSQDTWSYSGSGMDFSIDDSGSDMDLSIDESGSNMDLTIDDSGSAIDFEFDESSDGLIWFDASDSMEEGSMDFSFDGSEDFDESIEVGENEELDELIDLPEGASKFRLRVQNGEINVDIYTQDSEPAKKSHKKAHKTSLQLAAKEQSGNHSFKNFLGQAEKWIKEGYKTPTVMVAGIAAAAAVMIAIVAAVVTRRSSSSARSVLAIENGEPTEADLEVDEESTDATPVLESQEDDEEEEEEGVVEASV